MAHGMNASSTRGILYSIITESELVSTAHQIAAHLHPKDGKITQLNYLYNTPLVRMYKQYMDRLVEETRVWRGLIAKRAHYADMIEKLAHMGEGETSNSQTGPQDLEDLDLLEISKPPFQDS